MKSEAIVYIEPVAIAGRLDALGIDQLTLVDSVKEGAAFVLDCTRHDPLTCPASWGRERSYGRSGITSSQEGGSIATPVTTRSQLIQMDRSLSPSQAAT